MADRYIGGRDPVEEAGPDDLPEADHNDGQPTTDEFEVASGTRRVSRGSRLQAARQRADGARGGADRARPRRPVGDRGRGPVADVGRSRSWAGRILSVIALVVVAGLIWLAVQIFQPFHGSGSGRVAVTIPAHSSTHQVGDLLERDGVVSSSLFFRIRALLSGDGGKLRSGTYVLAHGMSYSAALKALTTPPPPVRVSNITIIEGKTRAQVDALLREQRLGTGYLQGTVSSPLLNPTTYGAPKNTPSLEGFLFPSTYQLRDPIRISALIADQLKTFKQRFATVNFGYARAHNLTPYDVLIIASLVQAEAGTAHDFPLVASVIYNRLRLGMALQLDATTRYATGNYTQPLTESQLHSSSPYNTRDRLGLPPTPIDAPGMTAIQAAAHPPDTGYLYFVVKPCGNGQSEFFNDYDSFLNASAQYQQLRAENGGRAPNHC